MSTVDDWLIKKGLKKRKKRRYKIHPVIYSVHIGIPPNEIVTCTNCGWCSRFSRCTNHEATMWRRLVTSNQLCAGYNPDAKVKRVGIRQIRKL